MGEIDRKIIERLFPIILPPESFQRAVQYIETLIESEYRKWKIRQRLITENASDTYMSLPDLTKELSTRFHGRPQPGNFFTVLRAISLIPIALNDCECITGRTLQRIFEYAEVFFAFLSVDESVMARTTRIRQRIEDIMIKLERNKLLLRTIFNKNLEYIREDQRDWRSLFRELSAKDEQYRKAAGIELKLAIDSA
jgi:hypothetical protein